MTYPQISPSRIYPQYSPQNSPLKAPSTLALGAARRRAYHVPPPVVARPGTNRKALIITGAIAAVVGLVVAGAFVAGAFDSADDSRAAPAMTSRGQQAWEYTRNLPESGEAALAELREEIRISREKYPAILDVEKGLGASVVENNGWADIELGARITGGIAGQEPAWFAQLNGLADRRDQGDDDSSEAERDLFEQAIADTGPLTQHIYDAGSRGVIVPMSRVDELGVLQTETAHLSDFLDIMLGRVVVHFERGRTDAGRDELLALVKLCSRCNDDRTRAGAEWWSAYRNRVLKVGVLAAITRGQLTVADVKQVLEFRWRTEGNDKQMWLNNLAATVARYQWSLDHDNAGLLPKGNAARTFTEQGARDLHAYAFHVKTAREHVDEAEHNELNLRSDEYVAKYLVDYTGNELLDLAEG